MPLECLRVKKKLIPISCAMKIFSVAKIVTNGADKKLTTTGPMNVRGTTPGNLL